MGETKISIKYKVESIKDDTSDGGRQARRARHDSSEVDVLYKNYTFHLFRFISSKIEHREDAEEILQDTWMSIFDSLPLFAGRSSFLTWAKSIASHEVADFYRKRKIKSLVFSHLPFLENLVSEALGPEMVYQQKEIRQDLERALNRLSEGYGKILRLKYIEGHSMAKIASSFKISIKAVESRLSRAREAFQKEWQENYQYEFCASLPFLPSKKAT